MTPHPHRPTVVVDGRELAARHVVVAGGAWLPRLVPGLAGALTPVRRVLAWFPAHDPAQYAPDRFPVFMRTDHRQEQLWYGCPAVDGRTVKVSLHHAPGLDEAVDPTLGPRPPDQSDAARLGPIVAETLPGLVPVAQRMVACTYTMTPDAHFVVGQRRDLPGLTVLGGFSGHGFKFAPVIGEVAAQLALDGRTDLPINLFDPHRFDKA